MSKTSRSCNNITTSGSFGHGITLSSSSNSNTLSNNIINISGSQGLGITLSSSSNSNTLSNNIVTDSGYAGSGIYLSSSSNLTLLSNVITISGNYARGITLSSGVNLTISNNTITTSGNEVYGIYWNSGLNSTISNNKINTFEFKGYGIYLSSSSNLTIINNNINTSGTLGHGIYLETSSNLNTIQNNNVTTSGTNSYGLYLISSSGNNTLLNNQITTGSKAILDDASGTGNLLIYNNLFGEIKWVNDAKGFLNNLTTMGNITFPGTIAIKYNSVFVNSSYFYNQKINSSADIILYGIDVIRPVILRDAAPCGINCINSTSLNSEIVKFRINSWSEYGIGETFYCEDGICNNGETCSSCSGDCGSCPVVNSGSGGGGGSSNTGTSGCKANWTCSLWSACSSYKIQTRVCMDALKCNNLTGKPVESQACVYTGANETIVTGENKSNENLVSANNAASLNDNNFFIKFWPYLLMVLVLILLSSVIVFILFLWLLKLPAEDRAKKICIGLIIGGAIGNMVDRVSMGYVIDFVDFYIGSWHYATFNVADTAICMGAVFLMIQSFRNSRSKML